MVTKIEHIDDFPIEDVKVRDRYRREKGDLEPLMDSIRERGLIHPIVIDQDNSLIVGERRLLAHKALKMQTIRVERITERNKISRTEIERDENIARADFTWADAARIERAIYEMKKSKDPKWTHRKHAEMRDSTKGTVTRRLQLAEAFELLPELEECETQDEAWKQYKKLEEEAAIGYAKQRVPETILKAPQWAHDHYIISDVFEGMEQTAPRTADFAEVDPPYAIEIDRRKSRNEDEQDHIEDYSEVTKKEYPKFFKRLAEETFRILKPNTFAVFWFGTQWHSMTYKALVEAGFLVNDTPSIWYKGQAGQTAQPDIMLASSYEPFWLARKGQPRMARQGRSNVFHFSPVAPSRKIHITERPIAMMEDILGTILFPGSTIVVPFLGSGVTLRAAYRLGHTGFGWDKSERHKERFLKLVAGEHGNDGTDEEE